MRIIGWRKYKSGQDETDAYVDIVRKPFVLHSADDDDFANNPDRNDGYESSFRTLSNGHHLTVNWAAFESSFGRFQRVDQFVHIYVLDVNFRVLVRSRRLVPVTRFGAAAASRARESALGTVTETNRLGYPEKKWGTISKILNTKVFRVGLDSSSHLYERKSFREFSELFKLRVKKLKFDRTLHSIMPKYFRVYTEVFRLQGRYKLTWVFWKSTGERNWLGYSGKVWKKTNWLGYYRRV